MHIELLTCAATAAATTGAAATALAGDSLVIKNANRTRKVHILSAWQTNQTAGFSQITFPSAHDTTRGHRTGVAIGVNMTVLPFGIPMEVQPQETLAPTIAATAVAGDVENLSLLVRYEDLPGIDARLMKADVVESRIESLTTIENSLATTAGPSYGTPELITADSDLLKANRDYALLGFQCRTAVHAIYMLGPDFGNVRVGCPGALRPEITSQWFMLQSRLHNEPLVPVVNSGNKNSTFIGAVTDENAGTFVVTALLALLK
jgi:hypothetical protein